MEWHEVARLRQGLYRFFGAALLPPDLERLRLLQAAAGTLDDMGVDAFAFARSWRRFTDALTTVEDPIALGSDYIRLFEAGVGDVPVPLFESAYRADARSGGTGALLASIRRRYADLGLEPDTGVTGGIDHLSIELETMAALCAREAEAWETGAEARVATLLAQERSFLADHPGAWIPKVTDRLHAMKADRFYRALGDALHAFTHHDREFLAVLEAGVGTA
ncbi:MAG: hypothetical protein KatS3mg011_1666 [Acidimicrobiia bacterium]|nr:MAG: hypothetical protein KatS3mg011_1666 [Acidimicrobiia bacterium]